jgi:NAD(P)-dependent dehydrogenase (short-subunit alcohol dehydrogenase family)
LDNNGNLSEPDRRTIQVDLNAASDTVKLAIHWLRKNKNGGSIVMTSSLSGYQAAPGAPLYSAAKHGKLLERFWRSLRCSLFQGILGLMRALKGETAKLNIAISISAPGITVTNLLKANDEGLSVEEWVSKMRKTGLAINSADSVALAACHLINSGMQANGKGVMIQENKMAEIEKAVSKSRPVWMGKEMWDLYRGVGSGNVFSRI